MTDPFADSRAALATMRAAIVAAAETATPYDLSVLANALCEVERTAAKIPQEPTP